MSDKSNDKPEGKLTAYERWELPHLKNDNPKVDTGPAILIRNETVVTTEEVDESTLVYEPLTASQLEEIRSAAYEEGFIQGESEGHKKGYEDGFSKGEVDGFEKGHEKGQLVGAEEGKNEAVIEAQSQLANLEKILNSAAKEIELPLEESRSAIEALLYKTMTRVIENVCLTKMSEDNHQSLKSQLVKVFEEIGEYQGRIRLHLHPKDVSVLEGLDVQNRLTLQIEADESLIEGGFIIDSKSFHVDGRVEQRLEAICNELRHLSLSEQG